MKFALSLSCIPVALIGISQGATLLPMPTVKVDTVLSTGPAATLGSVQISTGSVRADGTAPPTNGPSSGQISPQVSGTPSTSATSGEATTSGRATGTTEEGPSSGHKGATNEPAANGAVGTPGTAAAAGTPATRGTTTRNGKIVPVTGAPATSAKGVIPPPEITYQNAGAFHLNVEAGYASKHIWRGIDLPQFTSYNYIAPKKDNLSVPSSDVTFIGANINYNGFLFGIKYIETIDNTFNPFFAPYLSQLDSYSELVLSANYTRMLVGPDWLQGTLGVDFYYYPNDLFWGVSNQGMAYVRFSSPHYKWAQPFLEIFYNFAIDSTGAGYAADKVPTIPAGMTARGATGSQLVEGCGFELGVSGGDRVWANDNMSLALTYSVSTIYKSGYAFENDGFSQLIMTVGAPVTIGSHLTITPSVSYVEGLSHIAPQQNAVVPGGGSPAEIWNSPGWVAVVKANWQF